MGSNECRPASRHEMAESSIKWGPMNAGLLMDAMLFSRPGPAPNRGQAPQRSKGPKTSQHHVPPGFCFSLHKGGDCTSSGCTWNHSCRQCNRGNSLKNCRNRDGPQPRESTQSKNLPHNKRQGEKSRKSPVDRKPGEPTAHEPAIVLVPRLHQRILRPSNHIHKGIPPEEVSFLEESFTLGFHLGVQLQCQVQILQCRIQLTQVSEMGRSFSALLVFLFEERGHSCFFESSGSTPSHNEC